jgi:hypothetical protein
MLMTGGACTLADGPANSAIAAFPIPSKTLYGAPGFVSGKEDHRLISKAWQWPDAFGGRFDALYFDAGGSPQPGFL